MYATADGRLASPSSSSSSPRHSHTSRDPSLRYVQLTGPVTKDALHLLNSAQQVLRLRTALMNAEWFVVKSIIASVEKDKLPEVAQREFTLAEASINYRTCVQELTRALSSGMATGAPGALVLVTISTKELDLAIRFANQHPVDHPDVTKLLGTARVIRELRSAMKANKWQGYRDDDMLAADERVQATAEAGGGASAEVTSGAHEPTVPSPAPDAVEEKAVTFGAVATPKGAMRSLWGKVKLAVKTVKTVKEAGIASVKAVLANAAEVDL